MPDPPDGDAAALERATGDSDFQAIAAAHDGPDPDAVLAAADEVPAGVAFPPATASEPFVTAEGTPVDRAPSASPVTATEPHASDRADPSTQSNQAATEPSLDELLEAAGAATGEAAAGSPTGSTTTGLLGRLRSLVGR